MDGRGYGPRRGVVSRCGRCDCRRTVKMKRIKREDIPRAVVLALAGRPTSRPSCFGRNAPDAAAAALSPSLSPFGFGLGLMHHASSLHFSYPMLRRLYTDSAISLPSRRSAAQFASRQVTQLQPSLSLSLSAFRATCVSCVSATPLRL